MGGARCVRSIGRTVKLFFAKMLDGEDKGRLFIELTRDGAAEFLREIVERSIPSKKSWRGYDVIRIVDPDGNELLFPLPASGGEASRAA
jgi:hypothetical protein